MAKTPEQLAREKALAGAAAAQWVSPGARLGIGSGSTVQAFIDALAARATNEGWTPNFMAASKESADHATAKGFQPLQAGMGLRFDLVVDGADEIGPGLDLIKGGGGALLHEKILASAADLLLIIGDSSKPVATLGRFPLPVEVVPFAAFAIESRLVALGLKPIRRPSKADPTQPFITEEGTGFMTARAVRSQIQRRSPRPSNAFRGSSAMGCSFEWPPWPWLLTATM